MKVVLHVRAKEEEEPGRAQEKCLISVQAVLSFVAWGLGFLHVGGDERGYVWNRQLGSAQTAPTATPQLITRATNHLSCPYANFPILPPSHKGATCLISGLRQLPAPRIFCLLTKMRVSCTSYVVITFHLASQAGRTQFSTGPRA